jgi:endonuclease/exonuclease/phosphatase (EEP) superfamily protein YafD
MMERFGLHRALPKNEKMIKSVLGQPLDHVYYRGLTLTDALVIDTPVSDHNPIFTKFLV